MALWRVERSPVPPGRDVPGQGATEGLLVALDAAANILRGAATTALLRLLRLYQVTLSPYVGRQCRFHPTCSEYALEAIARHGPLAGASLAVRRLLKCHPFHPGGVDLPPASGD